MTCDLVSEYANTRKNGLIWIRLVQEVAHDNQL